MKNKQMAILDYLKLDIKAPQSEVPIDTNQLFDLALRKNPKRSFLFVSKLLGKHLAVAPHIPTLSGALLSTLYMGDKPKMTELISHIDGTTFTHDLLPSYQLDRPTLVIGFAETATGLGHAMFNCFTGNVQFIHTTRETIFDLVPAFSFEETHSHATSHVCYHTNKDYFCGFENMILVDDEITTGNTALNLIEALTNTYHPKSFTVMSILDWRNEGQKQAAQDMCEKLGVEITFKSLYQGELAVTVMKEIGESMLTTSDIIAIGDSCDVNTETRWLDNYLEQTTFTTENTNKEYKVKNYLLGTGRFGLTPEMNKYLLTKYKVVGEYLKELRQTDSCICLGTEELMYIPSIISSYMGDNVTYQSTTRSPIIAIDVLEYPIKSVLAYQKPEDITITNYVYNCEQHEGKDLFWFLESDVPHNFKENLTLALKQRGIKNVYFIVLTGEND